jgi:hypothetical protein
MLEKVNQLAEQAATNVSRRQFFGRLGKGAMFAAGLVAAVLAVPSSTRAGRGTVRCCIHRCAFVEGRQVRRSIWRVCDTDGFGCDRSFSGRDGGCTLERIRFVGSCKQC